MIDLNYEELTSMDTSQNKVIVEEELGQDYNPEDEDIVFIDSDSESDIDYKTWDCIYHSHRTVFITVIKKEKKQFFSFKAISDVKIFGLQNISDANIFRHFFCPEFFALIVSLFNYAEFNHQKFTYKCRQKILYYEKFNIKITISQYWFYQQSNT